MSSMDVEKNREQNAVPPKDSRSGSTYEKVFKVRESYLTNSQARNMVWIVFLVLATESVCLDYFTRDRIMFGLPTVRDAFTGLHYMVYCWLGLHMIAFVVFWGFKIWYSLSKRLVQKPFLCALVNLFFLPAYIASQLFIFFAIPICCFKLDTAYASALALGLETCRLLMKMHAFVRTNVGKASGEAADDPIATYTPPTFRRYLYFLFAPTLLYRNEYPRSPGPIRWSFSFYCFVEVVLWAFIFCFIFENHVKVISAIFDEGAITLVSLVRTFCHMLLPGVFILSSCSYLILHSVQNCAAELLQFGDRMFYKTWWTCSSYSLYFRNWNCVVHDWLFEYIFKDFTKYVFCGSRICALLTVFVASAAAHEYVMICMVKSCMPVIFLLMTSSGIFFAFSTRKFPQRFGNIFFWVTFTFGSSLTISLYAMEFYAQIHCPKTHTSIKDYLIPYLLSCNFTLGLNHK